MLIIWVDLNLHGHGLKPVNIRCVICLELPHCCSICIVLICETWGVACRAFDCLSPDSNCLIAISMRQAGLLPCHKSANAWQHVSCCKLVACLLQLLRSSICSYVACFISTWSYYKCCTAVSVKPDIMCTCRCRWSWQAIM